MLHDCSVGCTRALMLFACTLALMFAVSNVSMEARCRLHVLWYETMNKIAPDHNVRLNNYQKNDGKEQPLKNASLPSLFAIENRLPRNAQTTTI